MSEFEQYIKTTPEYTALVLQHGERLFINNDGEYKILTIRLVHRVWVKLNIVNSVMNEYYTGSFHTIGELAGEVSLALQGDLALITSN